MDGFDDDDEIPELGERDSKTFDVENELAYEDIVFTDTQESLTKPIVPVVFGKQTRPNTREESVEGLRRMVQRLHERNLSKSSA